MINNKEADLFGQPLLLWTLRIKMEINTVCKVKTV